MMNKKEIFGKISAIVKEIQDQHAYLSENPDTMNELELELFLANSKFLTGHIEVYQKLNYTLIEHIQVPEHEAKAEPVVEKTIEPKFENLQEEENVTRFFLEADPIDDDGMETTISEEDPVIKPIFEPIELVQKLTTQEIISEEKGIFPVKEPVISLSPVEPEHVPTVNDLMFAQLNSQDTLAGQFTSQPVKDLKSIISLNDKLLFIKDLFNGYSLAYSEAIEVLNRFTNFESADNFLKSNYSAKNNWASKQYTVDHFYELLNRRFGR